MLKRIRLENFKSWKELDIELAPLTLLFGTNSSGKTSILQSLLLLKQTASSLDPGEHINFGSDQDYVNLGSFRDVSFDHTNEQPIAIGLEWSSLIRSYFSLDDDEDYFQYELGVRYKGQWLDVQDQIALNTLEYETLSDSREPRVPNPIIRATRRYNLDYVYEVSSPWSFEKIPFGSVPQNAYVLPHSLRPEAPYDLLNPELNKIKKDFDVTVYNFAFKTLMEDISYLGPLREPPKRTYQWQGSQSQIIGMRGDNAINALIASSRGTRTHKNLLEEVSTWLQRLGLGAELTISAIDRERRFYETLLTVTAGRPPSSLPDVGFGVSQVLPVLTLLFFAPEGSIVLIEQPELHLHPSAQAELADLFLEVAEKRKLQLIVESHSEHLLRRLQRRIAEADYAYATPENIRAYFCEPGSEGSTIREVEVDEYGQIRNWPENFFGDLAGDLDAMMSAALERRRRELSEGG